MKIIQIVILLLSSSLPVIIAIGDLIDSTTNNFPTANPQAANMSSDPNLNYKPKGNLSCIHFNNDLFMTLFNSSSDFEEMMGKATSVPCYWRKSNGSMETEWRQFVDVRRIEIRNSTLLKIPERIFSNFSKLYIFKARDTKIQEVHVNDFMAGDFLLFLDLSRNELKKLESKIFTYLKSIKEIDLSYNKIDTIADDSFDVIGANFTRIDLSNNKLKTFKEDFFLAMISNSGRKWLPFDINLKNNEIEIIEGSKKNAVVLPEINLQLTGNKIKNLELLKIEIFELVLKNSSLESINVNASYVNADNNKLKTYRVKGKTRSLNLLNNSISSITFDDYLTVIRVLNLAGNKLNSSSLYELLKKVTYIETLDISHNPIKVLKVDMFSELLMLQKLLLSNISISELTFGIFAYQASLKLLDVSYNNFSDIDFHVFSSNTFLEILDISGTNISKIKDCKKISEILPKLKLLGVEDNQWKCDVLSKTKTCLNSQLIKFLIPDRPTKNESNIMGVKCSYNPNDTVSTDFPPTSTTHSSLFVSEIMNKIKELDEKIVVTKSSTTQGITSTELILSVLLSIALTVFVMYGVNKLKNHLKTNRFRMPNFSRRDSPDTIVTYDGNNGH